MLLTVCTIRQLPQAFALGASLTQQSGSAERFVIGLADDPDHLPARFDSPYPLLTLAECLPDADEVARLSAIYTTTEFVAACKPAFINTALQRYPAEDHVIYVDPSTFFYQPLTNLTGRFAEANLLLTPHITRPPDTANRFPDEKYFQNVGLYSSGFLLFKRSAETARLLAWWQDRVMPRAFIDFCAGLCTDQLWLMHVPVFFDGVVVVKETGWQVAVWNLPERLLVQQSDGWHVTDSDLLQFVNFRGLSHPDEGLFAYQNRLQINKRPDVQQLLLDYRKVVAHYEQPALLGTVPAFGQRPVPIVLRGWRRSVADLLKAANQFIDTVPLPVIR